MARRILFDLEKTLYQTDLSLEEDFFRKNLSGDVSKFLSMKDLLFKQYLDVNKTLCIEREGIDEYSNYADKKSLANYLSTYGNVSFSLKVLNEYIEFLSQAPVTLTEELIPNVLENLKNNGYELGVITEEFRDVALAKMKKTGIYQYMDIVVTADDAMKPAKNAYRLAAKRFLDVDFLYHLSNTFGSMGEYYDPKDLVIVGDNLKNDCLIPREYGIQSVLYEPVFNENIVGGRKIKSLGTLNYIYQANR